MLMRRFCETLDEGVFRSLADRHYRGALRVAETMLDDGALAHDAVQETLVRVVRHRKRYDPDKPFAPWLFTILRNVCIDLKRKQARRFEVHRRFAELLEWPRNNDTAEVRAAALLEMLPENDARLLNLRYVEGATAVEIAGRVGCSVEAVKKRFQRIIQRLRVEWRKPGGL